MTSHKNPTIRIAFMGDVNPGGILVYTGGVSEQVKEHLSLYDIRVATLESAIGENISFDAKKMANPHKAYIIFSPDSSVDKLKELQLDAVSLANNHTSDCGLEGLYHTIDVLDKNHISHFGAGHDNLEAEKACILEVKDKKIALLGYCTPWNYLYEPNDKEGGTNLINAEKMINDVTYYKAICDYVFVLPHWGKEKTILPSKDNIRLAKDLIKAGASGVIGSHTHTVQPILSFKKRIIAMSLGNFLFPDRYIRAPKVVCYPTIEEIASNEIPITEAFPLVDKLTYKRIPDVFRRGIILDIKLKGAKIKFKKHYTYMSNDHIVSFKNNNILTALKLIVLRVWMRSIKPSR